MTDSNKTTLQSYEAHVQEYIDGTPQGVDGVVKEWVDKALSGLSHDARILEFGSAFGRDATYIQSLGYTVECTDATEGFVKLLQEKGFNARMLNAITDEIEGEYDLVLANAVLLHFTREETATVLRKVLAALRSGGKFAFTVKQGEGEKWSEDKLGAPRYFCYWTKSQMEQVLADAGYANIEVMNDRDTKTATWIHVIASRPE
jgi:2-polyprenyl-3-methyl-5-hydroxy-6-metoxy-1,4-benzoquinol methylase